MPTLPLIVAQENVAYESLVYDHSSRFGSDEYYSTVAPRQDSIRASTSPVLNRDCGRSLRDPNAPEPGLRRGDWKRDDLRVIGQIHRLNRDPVGRRKRRRLLDLVKPARGAAHTERKARGTAALAQRRLLHGR